MPNSRRKNTRTSRPRLGHRFGFNKYGAKRTTVDGIVFHSKAEAQRYGVLRLQEKAGEISDLRLQVKYELHVVSMPIGLKPIAIKIGSYVADFVYVTADGESIVEDKKGFRTPLYNWKKKHVEAEYGIVITET